MFERFDYDNVNMKNKVYWYRFVLSFLCHNLIDCFIHSFHTIRICMVPTTNNL